MKTPQKQAPKWRPGGRGCGGEQDLTATCPARRGASSCPQASAPDNRPGPGSAGGAAPRVPRQRSGWRSWPQSNPATALAPCGTTRPPHPAAALTPVCVYEVQHPLGGGAGSLVNGRAVSPRSRRPVRVGPEEPLGVCKAGRPAVQPQALQAGTFHPKSPATGAGRAAEGTGPRGHALGSPA